MVELKNISKTYFSKHASAVKALKNINLEFDEKGMVFLLGKSGCGKSTMLNIIGGLDSYDLGGELIVNSVSTKNFNAKDFDNYRNRFIGMVFQDFLLLDDLNVEQNVRFPLELQKNKDAKNLALEMLEKVGLGDLANRKISELSGGQKQRVAIARAMVKNPKIILADEPTGNLDSQTSTQIFDLLKEISKTTLLIVVTHDRESAFQYGDRVVEIADGEIVKDTLTKIAS